jgi:DNA-binding ferritin-like protein
MSNSLQMIVNDLISLSISVKLIHWNVRGYLFSSVHALMDEVHGTAVAGYDDIAERMGQLDCPVKLSQADIAIEDYEDYSKEFVSCNRALEIAQSLLEPLIDMVAVEIDKAGRSYNSASRPDLVTQNILIDLNQSLEKHLWFITSSLDEVKEEEEDDELS